MTLRIFIDKIKIQITLSLMQLKICDHCYSEELENWKGWPHRDPLPQTNAVFKERCPICSKAESFQFQNYYWKNIHSEFSTGLPDYWLISSTDDYDRDRLQKRWGRPFLKLIECKNCGQIATLSEHMNEQKTYCLSGCNKS